MERRERHIRDEFKDVQFQFEVLPGKVEDTYSRSGRQGGGDVRPDDPVTEDGPANYRQQQTRRCRGSIELWRTRS